MTPSFNVSVPANDVIGHMPDIFKCKVSDDISNSYEFSWIANKIDIANKGINVDYHYFSDKSAQDIVMHYSKIYAEHIHNHAEQAYVSKKIKFGKLLAEAERRLDEYNPGHNSRYKYFIASGQFLGNIINKMDINYLNNNDIYGTLVPIGRIGYTYMYLDTLMAFNDNSIYMCYGTDFNYSADNIRFMRKSEKELNDKYRITGTIKADLILTDYKSLKINMVL